MILDFEILKQFWAWPVESESSGGRGEIATYNQINVPT